MYSRNVLVQNRTGLHARPASEFVALAKEFQSKITTRLASEEDAVNAKSIMRLLTIGVQQGDEIVIEANGEDETNAVDALVKLVESRFGEE